MKSDTKTGKTIFIETFRGTAGRTMIWLIGNRGMLGSDVERLIIHRGLDYIASDMEVDILDERSLLSFATENKPDWIINCAAYTHVDDAEEEPDLAYTINATGAGNFARVSKETGARLIHLSTDYVFDGIKRGPYTETNGTNPQSVYGKSKLDGELRVKRMCTQHFVVRTAWLYGMGGGNFVHTMIRLFRERETVKVVDDQCGSPTYTRDLAEALLIVIHHDSTVYGTYHFTNEGITSWYGFAKEIYQGCIRHGFPIKQVHIVPVKTGEYPAKAVRPRNSVLSKEKFKKTFKTTIHSWETALNSFIREIADRNGDE